MRDIKILGMLIILNQKNDSTEINFLTYVNL